MHTAVRGPPLPWENTPKAGTGPAWHGPPRRGGSPPPPRPPPAPGPRPPRHDPQHAQGPRSAVGRRRAAALQAIDFRLQLLDRLRERGVVSRGLREGQLVKRFHGIEETRARLDRFVYSGAVDLPADGER